MDQGDGTYPYAGSNRIRFKGFTVLVSQAVATPRFASPL